jgi:ferredoxin
MHGGHRDKCNVLAMCILGCFSLFSVTSVIIVFVKMKENSGDQNRIYATKKCLPN